MSEIEIEELEGEDAESTEGNSRKDTRRIRREDRREMIRFEMDKEPRRSGVEPRKDDSGGNWQGVGTDS